MEHNFFSLASFNSSGTGRDNDTKYGNGDAGIDLNQQLIKNRADSFFMRVNSDAMAGAGIHKGDVVIVDRSLEVKSGKVIIAVVGGEMLIRRYEVNNGKRRLLPATNTLSPIDLVENSEFSTWGVVTYVIHRV